MHHPRSRLLIVGFAALLGSAAAWSATNRETTAMPTEAIWRVQEFDFHYRAAQGHFHSCEALHDKISGIMESIGAGSVIVQIACNRDTLVDRVDARVATAMPVPATSASIAEATTFDTEQQLVARLRQTQLPTPATIERFPAEWREVALTSINGVRLGPEDCDLLQDLHEQILPHLASVRVVRKKFSCAIPARPVLVVETLMRRAV
jgi:hypothetical protein